MKRLLPGAVFMLFLLVSPLALGQQSSTCQIQETFDGARVELVLDRLTWAKWPQFCDELAPYLDLSEQATAEVAVRVAARLEATTLFDEVQCVPDAASQDLRCVLTPSAIVRRVKVQGDIPFALLKRSVDRRVFLRPGLVLSDDPGILDRQRRRLEQYLEGEGFFGAEVELDLEGDKKGEPSRAVRVVATVTGGTPALIGGVSVAGAPPISPELADKKVRHFSFLWLYQDRFRPKLFEDDLEKIVKELRDRGYPAAQVTGTYERAEDDTINVYLNVDAGPWLDMTFAGNDTISTWRLRRLAKFSKTGTIDGLAIEDLRREILKAYQKKGRYDTIVDAGVSTLDDRIRLAYTIREGKKATIQSVRIQGAQSFSPAKIQQSAALATETRQSRLNPGYWVDDFVDRDVRAIRAFYRERGFERTLVEVERTEGEKGLEVIFKIQEGPFKPVRNVAVAGLPELVAEQSVLERLNTRGGGRLSTQGIARDEQRIIAELLSRGYLRANVSHEVISESDQLDSPVEIRFLVTPGRRYQYGGVFIRGNFRTHRRVITNTLGLERGDPLDLVALGRAKKQLRGLGVFSGVDLMPLPETEDGEIWLLATLEERDRRALELFATWETDDKGAIGATWRDSNFLGRAIRMEITGRVGQVFEQIPIRVDTGIDLPFGLGIPNTAKLGNVNEIEGLLRAPRPFGLPFDVSATASYILDDALNAEEEKARVRGRVIRQLLYRSRCRTCPDIIGLAFYQLSSQRKVIEGLNIVEGQTNVGKIGVSAILHRKDSILDARHGYELEAQVELAHEALAPGLGGATFWKVTGEYKFYRQLFGPFEQIGEVASIGPIVFASSVRVGAADAFGTVPEGQLSLVCPPRPPPPQPPPPIPPEGCLRPDELPVVPQSDAFSYGGDYSFRGAEKDASLVGFPNAEFLFLGRGELRWYILENIGFGSLQMAFFTDVASVSYNAGDLFKDTAVSIGPGVRYLTPVGPLSVEYAWGVSRPPQLREPPGQDKGGPIPKNGRFHVTFGYQF